jgi:hypothetical protein
MDSLMVIQNGLPWISYGDPLGVNLDKLDIHNGYPFGYPLWISNISKFGEHIGGRYP